MAVVKKLASSRKFWLAFIAVLVAGYLVIQGQITVEQFVDAIVALVGVLMAAIAGEDIAWMMSGREG